MYQHILIGLDESASGEAILPHAVAIATQFRAKLTLVHVNTSIAEIIAMTSAGPADSGSGFLDPTPIVEAERSEAASYLESVAQRLRQSGLDVDWRSPEGSTGDRIVSLADEIGADLIAMVTHGRAGLERALFGSVSDAVIRHAHCPLLLVRAPEAEKTSNHP